MLIAGKWSKSSSPFPQEIDHQTPPTPDVGFLDGRNIHYVASEIDCDVNSHSCHVGAGAGLLALVGGGRVLSVLTRCDTGSDAEEIILREGFGLMFKLDMMDGKTLKSPVKICRSLVPPDTSGSDESVRVQYSLMFTRICINEPSADTPQTLNCRRKENSN